MSVVLWMEGVKTPCSKEETDTHEFFSIFKAKKCSNCWREGAGAANYFLGGGRIITILAVWVKKFWLPSLYF